jgi:hypothetical protein
MWHHTGIIAVGREDERQDRKPANGAWTACHQPGTHHFLCPGRERCGRVAGQFRRRAKPEAGKVFIACGGNKVPEIPGIQFIPAKTAEKAGGLRFSFHEKKGSS